MTHQPPNTNSSPPTNTTPPAPRITPQRIAVPLPKKKPIATYAIMAVTVMIYFLQIGTEYLFKIDLPAALGMKVNELIARGQIWRLITPVFLHGSVLHIGFNMYALYLFGPGLERYYGKLKFAALYFISGFGGNVFSMMFSTMPSLGSSTAIFGLIGAQGVFIHHNRKMLGSNATRALTSLISVAVINLIIGMSPNIDNWGHIGGLLGGTLFAWYAGPLLSLEGIYLDIHISNHRQNSEVWLTALALIAFFVILAAGALFLQGK